MNKKKSFFAVLLMIIALVSHAQSIDSCEIMCIYLDSAVEVHAVADIDSIVIVKSPTKFYEEKYSPAEHAVDLGLSVKWADMNVGATTPDEIGDTFYWGATEKKGNSYQYVHDWEYQFIGCDISGTEYDVAHVKWGGGWRMPSLSEFEELSNKCTWVNILHKGFIITGPNGNSISMPYEESNYVYWTSSWHEKLGSGDAYCMQLLMRGPTHQLTYNGRFTGRAAVVRAVFPIDSNNQNSSSLRANTHMSFTMHVYRDGLNIAYPINEIDSIVYRTLTSPVNDLSSKSNYAIDLGLSVKWANMNIGANSLFDGGVDYSLGDSGWGNFKDYDCFSETDKDIAHEMWGDGWRMPTDTEWIELAKECSWSRATIHGVKGYVVIP